MMHHNINNFQNAKGLRWALGITLFIVGLEIAGLVVIQQLELAFRCRTYSWRCLFSIAKSFCFSIRKKSSDKSLSVWLWKSRSAGFVGE